MKMKFAQPGEVKPLVGPNSGNKKYKYIADFVAPGETVDGLANYYADDGWRLHSVWYAEGATWIMLEREV